MQVDAKLEAVADAGKSGQQTVGAQLHRQPTPDSIARAEQELREGAAARQAQAALDRARAADTKGDAAGCADALVEVRRALAR